MTLMSVRKSKKSKTLHRKSEVNIFISKFVKRQDVPDGGNNPSNLQFLEVNKNSECMR